MSDAVGSVQFMRAVSEIASGANAPSVEPVWDRELLNARDPPQITCVHHAYREAKGKPDYDMSNMISRSLFFGTKDILSLKNQMPPQLHRCSKFDILTACLWRCRTIALNYGSDDEVCVAFPVNARSKFSPAIPVGYYGNVLGFAAALSTAGELSQNPLSYAVELVKKAKADVTEEFMRSSADLMVKMGRPLYTTARTFKVTDLTHIGFEDVDFGWGKALYGGPCGNPWVSMFITAKNSFGEDGILVTIDFPVSTMEKLSIEIQKMIKGD